jgi:hypothetical protein
VPAHRRARARQLSPGPPLSGGPRPCHRFLVQRPPVLPTPSSPWSSAALAPLPSSTLPQTAARRRGRGLGFEDPRSGSALCFWGPGAKKWRPLVNIYNNSIRLQSAERRAGEDVRRSTTTILRTVGSRRLGRRRTVGCRPAAHVGTPQVPKKLRGYA